MLRCAILDDYQRVALGLAGWESLAGRVEVRSYDQHFATHPALVAAVADCDVLVVMRERTPFPAALFAQLPRLRLLVTSGMRNLSIDLAAAAAHGVTVCGTASRSEPPAELTWALILALARQITTEHAALRTGGPWQQTVGADLYGRRLGVLGLGKVGTLVARVGLAFGMEVMAWSQNLTGDRAAAAGVTLAASKAALLAQSDYVSIHLVLSDRTRGLIGEPELRRMRPTAYLVNTSRAAIVDQEALTRALREHWIAGAAVDVFEEEPLPADHVLRTMPNLLATPHLGYVTASNYGTYFQEAVQDIEAFLAGKPVRVLS